MSLSSTRLADKWRKIQSWDRDDLISFIVEVWDMHDGTEWGSNTLERMSELFQNFELPIADPNEE